MDSIYEESLANLRDRIPVYHDKEKKVTQSIAEKEQAAKVYYTNVKTNVLLAWVLSNVSAEPVVTDEISFSPIGRACSFSSFSAGCMLRMLLGKI